MSGLISQNQFTRSLAELQYTLDGNVKADQITRMLYACDASMLASAPLAVAFPKHKEDCKQIIDFARSHNIPILPRAGGTSLAGQAIGRALVVDVSRYMNNICAIDIDNKTARVQAGVIPGILNGKLQQDGLMFAPDPSTFNRCTISGMIGNNAWGVHCPIYGSTRDNISSLELLLTTGELVTFSATNKKQIRKLLQGKKAATPIYQTVLEILNKYQYQIAQSYPASKELVCNTAYPLHELLNQQPFNSSGNEFNLATLLCGSEGTLGLITDATLKLVEIAKHRQIICLHFNKLLDALAEVAEISAFNPSAIELLDKTLIDLCLNKFGANKTLRWLKGSPPAVLLVEFSSESEQALNSKVMAMLNNINRHAGHIVVSSEEINDVWSVRRTALGLLMGITQTKKPITFVEDSAVPLSSLAEFFSQVDKLMHDLNTRCVYYGSVSMGLVHIRPFLDMKNTKDIEKYYRIADSICNLLINFGGTMSAKHGDGRIRSVYIERQLGTETYNLIKQIKQCFDPYKILNPDIITKQDDIEKLLRVKHSGAATNINTRYDWSKDNGFAQVIEKCNGAGVCRRLTNDGVMCPSYKVTQDEKHCTRGRANVLRQVANREQKNALAHKDISEVLALCIMCKACRTECPAGVDMARIKSEHLYHKQKQYGIPFKNRILIQLDKINRMAQFSPWLFNRCANSGLVKRILGFHPSRPLPEISRPLFSQRFKQLKLTSHFKRPRILILNDVFTEFYEPLVGQACSELLDKLGYNVSLHNYLPSLRICISLGMLDQAYQRLSTIIRWLTAFATEYDYIIGLEPSETLCLRDEAPGLIRSDFLKQQLNTILRKTFLLEEFLLQQDENNDLPANIWNSRQFSLVLHVHCQQRSWLGVEPTVNALKLIPNCSVRVIPATCCGMAGLFGYEESHYHHSIAMGNLSLFPNVSELDEDTFIVSTGTSCRHQIKDGTGKTALHCAEIIRLAVAD